MVLSGLCTLGSYTKAEGNGNSSGKGIDWDRFQKKKVQ